MQTTTKFVLLATIVLFATPALAQEVSTRPKMNTAAEQQRKGLLPETQDTASTQKDSDAELRAAIQNARGGDQELIGSFENYLKKYPNSQHRNEIEQELYKLSNKIRDRNRMITYAARIVDKNLNDIDMLTALISLLRERRGEGDLQKALSYSNQLVEEFENIFTRNKPARVSVAQWEDRKARGLASVYMIRGRVQADLASFEKASADLLKSYSLSKFSEAAMTLAELAEKRKAADEAINYYAQAFVLSMNEKDGAERDEIRRRLGVLYKAKHGSETGLGDLLLKTWDDRAKEAEERLARVATRNINEGVSDPYQFKLTKLDGTTIKLSDYKGKVIIVNFWATWCGPCRFELPLLEKAMVKYSDDKDVVFLTLNTDEDRTLVEPYWKQQKYKLPMAYAEYLDDHFAVSAIPTTMIFDRQGNVSYRQAGVATQEDFVAMLSEKIEAAKLK